MAGRGSAGLAVWASCVDATEERGEVEEAARELVEFLDEVEKALRNEPLPRLLREGRLYSELLDAAAGGCTRFTTTRRRRDWHI